MNDRLTRIVEKLLCDRRFWRSFSRDPERAAAPFGLTDDELAAVKAGDAAQLVRLGLDPAVAWPRKPFSPAAALGVKKLLPALALMALVGAPVAGATTESEAAVRARSRRSRVARVSRYFGRQELGGRFHSRFARTGRAGRATSRAARGADAGRFTSRARSAARDFGIQPPPPPSDSN